jgi:hypothetical protein
LFERLVGSSSERGWLEFFKTTTTEWHQRQCSSCYGVPPRARQRVTKVESTAKLLLSSLVAYVRAGAASVRVATDQFEIGVTVVLSLGLGNEEVATVIAIVDGFAQEDAARMRGYCYGRESRRGQ